MTCCDMCGEEMKFCGRNEKNVTIGSGLSKYSAAVCSKCAKKLKKFINFEQVKNNKRRCDEWTE